MHAQAADFRPDQVEEFAEAYRIFGGGAEVPAAKLGTVLRSLGFCPTEAELADMRAAAGATLDFEALKGCIAKANEKTPSATELLNALKAFDHSGSGVIRTADLKCATSHAGHSPASAYDRWPLSLSHYRTNAV